ncbi:MAG: methionyl-tRNA formyltransferase [Clostridia bacterium]|nr:methionyl-tRNA formyltransferase [Clostridia bacterium]
MKILFMGTPDFALFSLKALVESGENVIGVVTQPDKPKGRGYELCPPPVKVYALEMGLPVYQPTTLRGDEFAALLAGFDPDLIVVVAYGKILPKNVLDYPKHGCINVHGSLLPAYRGAAPMQRAIIDGCKTTGVTTMYMAEGLDTGDMLLKTEIEIGEQDNFEDVHDRLAACGADTLLRTVAALRAGTLVAEKQDDALANYAAKIEKADCLLNFSHCAKSLHDRIRGLSPIPLAFTHTPDGKLLKILAAHVSDVTCPDGIAPGTVLSLEDGEIVVACGNNTSLSLVRVLPEGKGRMSAADFIRGRKIAVGDVLC